MDPILASIMIFAGNFAPRGWAMCDGRLLPIAQNSALFSILGVTYGGNGQTTFALPDLRGRAPIGVGTGPGLSPVALGEVAGVPSVTLTVQQMPAHTHASTATLYAEAGAGTVVNPLNNMLARAVESAGTTQPFIYTPSNGNPADNKAMASESISVAISPAGGGQPVSVMQPYLGLNYCIALEGVFPSRN